MSERHFKRLSRLPPCTEASYRRIFNNQITSHPTKIMVCLYLSPVCVAESTLNKDIHILDGEGSFICSRHC